MERKSWVDFVKAVAIYLVVLGHSTGLGAERGIIYAVHVPAFLMISGYLLPKDFGEQGLHRFWSRFLSPFLRLYLFFSVLSVSILLAQQLWSGSPVLPKLRQAIAGVLYGVEGDFHGFVHRNAPLWYFTFLCVSLWAVWLSLQASRVIGAAWIAPTLLALTCGAGIAFGQHWWPWYLNFAGLGGLFLWIGWAAAPALDRLAAMARSPILLALAVILSLLTVWLALHNGLVNINRARFGTYPPLSLLCAAMGTLALCLWGMVLPAWALWRRLSGHTLVIFCTHIYLISLTYKMPLTGMAAPMRTGLLMGYAAVVTLVCLWLSELTMPWLRRHVIGARGAVSAAPTQSAGN